MLTQLRGLQVAVGASSSRRGPRGVLLRGRGFGDVRRSGGGTRSQWLILASQDLFDPVRDPDCNRKNC